MRDVMTFPGKCPLGGEQNQ